MSLDYKKRITNYRDAILKNKSREVIDRIRWNGVAAAEALQETEGLPWQLRKGIVLNRKLSNISFEINDDDLFVGRIRLIREPENEAEGERIKQTIEKYPNAGGMNGHCEPNYYEICAVGIQGIKMRIHEKVKNASDNSKDAYRSFGEALDGFSTMIRNARTVAEHAFRDAPDWRRTELKEIIESCSRIEKGPPETFLDGLLLCWFVWIGLSYGEPVGCIAPGHIDRWLYPLYKKERDNGTLTKEKALALLEYLYLLVNEWWPDGSAIAVMVGGRQKDGNDCTNELSYLCLEALRNTRLSYPTVGVCWHDKTPEELTKLTVELIASGISTPAFFNDTTIRKGLEDFGVPQGESCEYINSMCVEITPTGSSNVWPASPYFNLCSLLLDEIKEQAVSENNAFPDFETFYASYMKRVAREIENATGRINDTRKERERYGRKPLQSVFTKDCIERGRDIDAGGGRYNWVECSFVGLANLADSLYVLQKEVFEKKNLTLAAMNDLLSLNFEGYTQERQRFLNGYPKYGQGNPAIDTMVRKIAENLVQLCKPYRMHPDNSSFVPGAFVWIQHERLGGMTGATPDGRIAGFAFADGAGPAQGRETAGPSAAILSVTSWDHSPFIGGIAFNIKVNRSLVSSAEDQKKFANLLTTYLKKGGFEVQVNVVDKEVLKKAKMQPEEYQDLVVRIGGYCDYFTRLSPGMQDEIIQRAEYTSW